MVEVLELKEMKVLLELCGESNLRTIHSSCPACHNPMKIRTREWEKNFHFSVATHVCVFCNSTIQLERDGIYIRYAVQKVKILRPEDYKKRRSIYDQYQF